MIANRKNRKKAINEFRLFLKNHHYDIIHCNCNFESEPYITTARKYGKCKIVAHAHDTLVNVDVSPLKRLQRYFQRKRIINKADSLFACSFAAGCDIFEKKTFAIKGTVINNIIDSYPFLTPNTKNIKQLKKEYNIGNDNLILGNISRFEDKKNQKFIVEVFEKLHQENPNAILVLGGNDGGALDSIKYLVKEKGLSNYVRFIGPRNDVNDWLHIFNIYLFPSLFEGLGIIALEAQCAGTPVLASPFIPKQTDLGIGLIDYLELDAYTWLDKIKNLKKNAISVDKRLEALKEKGYLDETALLLAYRKLFK